MLIMKRIVLEEYGQEEGQKESCIRKELKTKLNICP